MTLNEKKPFRRSFYFPIILCAVFCISALVFAAFYVPDREKPNAIRLETKNAKCVYIGNVDGTSMDAYKLTVDSVDYILIKSYQGVTITKAK